MSEELKLLLKGAMMRELESFFIAEADEIANGKIDRTKSYEEQGKESHVRELASEAIKITINNIKKLVDDEPVKKISWK